MRDEAKPPVRRFEDLIAWQKARALTRQIYETTRAAPLGNDFGLSRQLQRASVSVMANIAEGFERASRGEFHHFLATAKGSCAEVRSHPYVALDAGYLTQEQFEALYQPTEEVGRIIGGLLVTVQRRRARGD